MPFGPANSVPGTFCHPVLVCHSHSSPLGSPFIMRVRTAASTPRAMKFVVTNPPSGNPTTEFRPIGSGATAQPTQVSVGSSGTCVELENFDGLPVAMMDDEHRVHAIPTGPKIEAVGFERVLLGRIDWARTGVVGLLVRSLLRVRTWKKHRARAVANADQPNGTVGAHAGRDHPPPSWHQHEVFG